MSVGVLVLAVLVVLGAAGTGEGRGTVHSCAPHGWWVHDRRCICNKGYDVLGLTRMQFVNKAGDVIGAGYDLECCKHCRCTSDPEQELRRDKFMGRINKHPDVRAFSIRDDMEAVRQDMQVKQAVGRFDLNVSLGAFDALRPRFPECQPPVFDINDKLEEAEGVRAAQAFIESCTPKWEWAKQFHNPKNHDALILVAWLAFRPDQQRQATVSCTDAGYIGRWYESVMTMGLRAVILHDCVSPALQEVLQNNLITFQRVQHNTGSDIHFKQSPNDVRFVLFNEYLDTIHHPFEYLLMTDLHDVRYRRDPFSAMRSRPDIEIFIGADRFSYNLNPFTVEIIEWCAEVYAPLLQQPWFGDVMTLNCGIVGGQFKAVRRLLRHVVGLYKDRNFENVPCMEPWQRYCDMAMFAVALMTGYETLHEDPFPAGASVSTAHQPYKFVSGPPFASAFTGYLDTWPYYVIHK